ncbi:uncharacterized protein LY89DRAFT_624569 [Mollisia scopiformis]|uniref:YCII-related domain-containing protein n=1 Tax=Mollisia scopiformis TaxID=149040 RepID=A0A194WVY5_MOLSC|nr:uncharacterized protein LY89DRAFT_624569 [Mollisia scopiformis]KUJ12125.1 hypothetical protein LY89DRAFT_624569 [Mollisia scopiformis]
MISNQMSLLQSSSRIFRHQRSFKFIPRHQFLRTMASAPEKFEWMVIIPDVPGKLEKRMEVRPKHFEGLKTAMEKGFFKTGGALLDEVPKEGEGLKISGSTVVAWASSKEEVMEILKGDIYAKEGVWDLEKVQIWPFKCAFREKFP